MLLILAKLFGVPLKRVGVHPIVGHVLAGVILGPYILGIVSPSRELETIANVALLLLLFYTGLTTDFRELRRKGVAVITMGISGVVATFLLTYFTITFVLGMDHIKALFISIALSNTATETVAATIARLGGHDIKALVIGASFVDDVLAVFVISIISSTAMGFAVDIKYLIITTAIFMTTVLLLSQVLVTHAKSFYSKLSRDYLVFASTSIVLAFIMALIARKIGLSELVGAYLAGLIIGRGREYHDPLIRARVILSEFIEDLSIILEVLFVPMFFTFVGLLLTPMKVSTTLYLIGLSTAVIGKIIGCTPIAYLSLRDMKKGIAAGFAMTGRGALETALLKLGLDYGIIGLTEYSTIVSITLTTVIIAPLLYSIMFRKIT